MLLPLALLLYLRIGGLGLGANFVAMALIGFLLFGPDAILSGAAAQDAGGPKAAAIAAGLVNGIGSLGAVLQEVVTKGVSQRYGWDALFVVFIAFALLAAVTLLPVLRERPDSGASLRHQK
jgi:sugar phosphate permease